MVDLEPQLSRRESDEHDQLILDLEGMIGRPEGRRVLMWMLGLCGVYDMQFAALDAATNFNLGKRDVGIRVIAALNEVSPTAYPQLLLEAAREKPEVRNDVLDPEADD